MGEVKQSYMKLIRKYAWNKEKKIQLNIAY